MKKFLISKIFNKDALTKVIETVEDSPEKEEIVNFMRTAKRGLIRS